MSAKIVLSAGLPFPKVREGKRREMYYLCKRKDERHDMLPGNRNKRNATKILAYCFANHKLFVSLPNHSLAQENVRQQATEQLPQNTIQTNI